MVEAKKILAIVLITVLVQTIVILFFDLEIVKDAKRYDMIALNVSKGFGLTEDGKNPSHLYAGPPIVFGGIYAVFGHDPRYVKIFQAILFCLVCVLIYIIGTKCFDAETGFLAAIICAVYPPLFILPSILLSEFLFTAGLAILLYFYILNISRDSNLLYAVTGALSACLGHIRPNGLFLIFFLIAAAIFLIKDKKRYMRFAVISLTAFIVFMVPITYRNYLQFGKFVPVAGIEAVGIKKPPDEILKEYDEFSKGLAKRQFVLTKVYYEKAGIDLDEKEMRKKLEGPIGKVIPQDYTWRPKNLLDGIRRLYIGSYSDIYQIGIPLAFFLKDRRLMDEYPALLIWKCLLLLSSAAVFFVALFGFLFGLGRFINLLPVYLIIGYNTLFYLTYAFKFRSDLTTRYGLPVVPYVIMFAAYAVTFSIKKLKGEKNA